MHVQWSSCYYKDYWLDLFFPFPFAIFGYQRKSPNSSPTKKKKEMYVSPIFMKQSMVTHSCVASYRGLCLLPHLRDMLWWHKLNHGGCDWPRPESCDLHHLLHTHFDRTTGLSYVIQITRTLGARCVQNFSNCRKAIKGTYCYLEKQSTAYTIV